MLQIFGSACVIPQHECLGPVERNTLWQADLKSCKLLCEQARFQQHFCMTGTRSAGGGPTRAYPLWLSGCRIANCSQRPGQIRTYGQAGGLSDRGAQLRASLPNHRRLHQGCASTLRRADHHGTGATRMAGGNRCDCGDPLQRCGCPTVPVRKRKLPPQVAWFQAG